jgi:uncharacterized protein YkwD
MQYVFAGKSKIARFAVFAFLCVSAFRAEAFAQKIKVAGNQNGARAATADDLEAHEFQIFDLINRERARRGLNALTFDEDAADIARKYSKKMARENFFSHYDADGNSVLERAERAHLKGWSKIGENLFSVDGLERFDAFAVQNWMKSPAHRENILDRDWTATGVGIARSDSGEIFITQIFIKRN